MFNSCSIHFNIISFNLRVLVPKLLLGIANQVLEAFGDGAEAEVLQILPMVRCQCQVMSLHQLQNICPMKET